MLKTYWLLLLIIATAALLRVWKLPDLGILFGDAGRDLLVAAQAVEQRQLPLLGIPSSVPRFKQGPVTIWLEMLLYIVAGTSHAAYSYAFALIGMAAVIGLYEVVVVYDSMRRALFATVVLTFSPLAIAHARMPYHITPIPLLMVLFLGSLLRWWRRPEWSIGWVTLAWAGLFQFELAVFPLIALIPWVWWRSGRPLTKKMMGEGLVGLAIGLAPQLVFDISHRFQQLGTFVVWVGYRLVSILGVTGEHGYSGEKLVQAITNLGLYGARMVSVDQPLIAGVAGLLLVISASVSWQLWRSRQLDQLSELSWLATGLLVAAYLVHSGPSEAYFPPFLILVPLLLRLSLDWFYRQAKIITIGVVLVWALLTTQNIRAVNFFVSTAHPFNYGPSVGEQREVLAWLRSQQLSIRQLRSTQPGAKYPTYFDNYKWLHQSGALTKQSEDGAVVFIEPKDSILASYPDSTKIVFPTVDVYVLP